MRGMKKLFLAAFVIATFAFYSVHQRREGSNAAVAPVVAKSKSSLTPSPSTSPSPPSSSPPASPLPGATPAPTNAPTPAAAYRDGQYTGPAANAYYGYIQVKATIRGGQIADVQFLQYPGDRDTSRQINTQAMPYLKQEAIQAQSAHVDIISGATDSSQAFIESLTAALAKAQS
jgi:uncharacterized protein with FMN-binding domain